MLPLVGFFAVLALLLPRQTVAQAFGAALLACLLLPLTTMHSVRAGRRGAKERHRVPARVPGRAGSAATPAYPSVIR